MEFKQFRFYEFDSKKCIGWWLYTFEGFDFEVNIQGNEKEVDPKCFDYAIEILQNNYEDIVSTAKDRLQCWGPTTNKDYSVERIYFGKFTYGPEQILHSGFKVLLKTVGNAHEDIYGNYTINFNENRWPIGYEFSIA